MSEEKPPHPAASPPPSPARGEGCSEEKARTLPKTTLVSVGARAKHLKQRSDVGRVAPLDTDQPSPLVGEGGDRLRRSPGEGAEHRRQPKRPRPVSGLSNAELRSQKRTAKIRQLRSAMTDAERKLWSLLRNRKLQGHKFRRQFPIGPYFADFVCLEARLIVEADGGQHVDSAHDLGRDAWFRARGFRTVRLWNSDILANPEGILARIFAILSQKPADAAQIAEATP